MAKKAKKKKARSSCKTAKKKCAIKKKKITKKAARRKPSARKITAKKKTKAQAPAPSPTAGLEAVGEITHYFPHVNAGVIKLAKSLSVGEEIYIKGHTTDFKEKVESMQINRAPVQSAKSGDEIGILVSQRVRAGDTVYRV